MSDHIIALLSQALDAVGRGDQGRFLAATRDVSVSRQAWSTGRLRARSAATAACLLLATREAAFRDFVFTSDFADLHPYSTDVFTQCEYLLRSGQSVDSDGYLSVWRRAADHLLRVSLSPGYPGDGHDTDRKICNNAVALLGLGLVLDLPSYADRWHAIWTETSDRAPDFLRMNLAVLGSYAGHFAPQVAWALSLPDSRQRLALEIADLILFARHDESPSILHLYGECVCNRPADPSEYFEGVRGQPHLLIGRLYKVINTTIDRQQSAAAPGMCLAVACWTLATIALHHQALQLGLSKTAKSGLERRFARTAALLRRHRSRISAAGAACNGPLRKRASHILAVLYSALSTSPSSADYCDDPMAMLRRATT